MNPALIWRKDEEEEEKVELHVYDFSGYRSCRRMVRNGTGRIIYLIFRIASIVTTNANVLMYNSTRSVYISDLFVGSV